MYEDMTYENILDSMFSRIQEKMDSRESSAVYASLSTTAYSLAEMYFLLENYLNLVFPDTSAGEFMDRFALTFNVHRKASAKALRHGYFDKKIPIDSRFSTTGNESIVFRAVELSKEEDGIYTYNMECETPGRIGNEYYGSLIPIDYISGLGSAELGAIIEAGTDEETDESMRERLLAKMQRPSTSGNANDYYNWAMSCSGVGAAKIFPLADGPGTVKVVIADESKRAADETLIANVADYIEQVRPIGATVRVVSAVEKAVNISAKVKLSTGTNLGIAQNTFQNAVDEYLQSKSFDMEYISLARIGNLLMDITGVEDYSELNINGEAQNIILLDEEVAVAGTVRLEVM